MQNRRIAFPRGKAQGGSSAINAMTYVRGDRRCFDRWQDLGNPGWGYDDLLPVFRRIERNESGATEYRGGDGVHGPTVAGRQHEVVVAPGEMATVTDTVTLPATATTEPYFLRLPRDGAMSRWGAPSFAGQPASSPLLTASFSLNGVRDDGVLLTREVTYRWRDPAYGERRERLLVVPRVGVRLDRTMLVWPLESRDPRTVTVTLSHSSSDTTSGAVRLEVPAGWVAPPSQPF